MFKKYFSFLLVIIIAIGIFSYFQKNNSIVKKTPTILPSTVTQITKKETIFLQVDEPKNNLTVSNPILNISGRTIANAYVFVNDQELKANIEGIFSTTMTLEEGENYILVVSSDDLGNSVEKDILVTLESTN